jgi:hypothetical protein
LTLKPEDILFLKNASILLIEERERKDIIIGAPHHSVGGEKQLPCIEHPDADENTGFIARQIAEILKLSSVIACNYRVDPNKDLRTDYSMQIAQWAPKYLIEIHGHGAKAIKDDLVEITAGNIKRNEFSKAFSSALQTRFNSSAELKKYRALGDFSKLYFKGTKTATITDDRWMALQIELPPSLRLDPNDNKPPTQAAALISALIETIKETCK